MSPVDNGKADRLNGNDSVQIRKTSRLSGGQRTEQTTSDSSTKDSILWGISLILSSTAVQVLCWAPIATYDSSHQSKDLCSEGVEVCLVFENQTVID